MMPLTSCTVESNSLICIVENLIHMRNATMYQRNAIPAKGITYNPTRISRRASVQFHRFQ